MHNIHLTGTQLLGQCEGGSAITGQLPPFQALRKAMPPIHTGVLRYSRVVWTIGHYVVVCGNLNFGQIVRDTLPGNNYNGLYLTIKQI